MKKYKVDFDFKGDDYVKKGKNVVIGLFRRSVSNSNRSHINRSLEGIQVKLKECATEADINLSFVFGENKVWASDFSTVLPDTPVKYLENSEGNQKSHHVWFLGQAILEKKMKEDKDKHINNDNYFILLVDDVQAYEVERISAFLKDENGELPQENLGFIPILIAKGNVIRKNDSLCKLILRLGGQIRQAPWDADEAEERHKEEETYEADISRIYT